MIKKISTKLYGVKNMMILLTGTGIGKLIGIISIPIVTRIYAPSDLGVFIALSSILIPIGTSKKL